MILSIITITYNNLTELKRTLDSIPKFDFIESIVVNGGNSHETTDYLKSYQGIVINEKDEGMLEEICFIPVISDNDLLQTD